MPTIAIIGGGTGGHFLAARLLEKAGDGQRLHVTLVEGSGRAGQHLRRIVRDAERTAPGAFLTRMRGEAISIAELSDGAGVRVGLRTGRVLDVDRAILITGSVAADGFDPDALAGLRLVYSLISEAPAGELSGAAAGLAAELLDGLRTTPVENRESVASSSAD